MGRGRGEWRGRGVGRHGSIPNHYSLLKIELQFLKVRCSIEVPAPRVLGGEAAADGVSWPNLPTPPTLLPSQYRIPKSTNEMLSDVSTAAICV